MSVESATYLSQLVATNPASADAASDGATHLRLLKSVLLATFANVAGAVTSDHNALNRTVPIGTVCLWYGAIASIPAGWAFCDGSSHTRTDGGGSITTPNLKDKLILGADTLVYTPGTTSAIIGAGSSFSIYALAYIMRI